MMDKFLAIVLVSAIGTGFSPELVVAQEREAEPSTTTSEPIWGCSAGNQSRRYVVDQLRLSADSFDIAIYTSNRGRGDDRDYIGTVKITLDAESTDSSSLYFAGRGETFNSSLEVSGLGRTVAFSVDDSVTGLASGRCSVQWQMADRGMRRLVRQCLALVARKDGGAAEVSRFGCTTAPESYMEEFSAGQQ